VHGVTLVRALTFALCLCALCLTFSRAAWIACIITAGGLSFWTVRRGVWQWRRALRAGALGALIVATFSFAYAPFLQARAGVRDESVEQISVAQRGIFIAFAWQIIERYPIAGTGIGTFAWEARDLLVKSPYRGLLRAENVHSVPLLILSELGAVGMVLWSALLAAWARIAWHNRRDCRTAGARCWRLCAVPDRRSGFLSARHFLDALPVAAIDGGERTA
jgi:O-antigen ligase